MNNDYNNNNDYNSNNNTEQESNGQNQQNGGNGQYYDPNGQYYNPNGQYYNPNGQYYHPGGNPGQFHPDSFFYPPQQTDACGKTAQTFGIIALVSLLFCQILSIIFGALAMSNAKKSVAALGFECSEAKNGRVMGLVGLIVGIVQIAAVVLVYILVFLGLLFA